MGTRIGHWVLWSWSLRWASYFLKHGLTFTKVYPACSILGWQPMVVAILDQCENTLKTMPKS